MVNVKVIRYNDFLIWMHILIKKEEDFVTWIIHIETKNTLFIPDAALASYVPNP